MHILNPQVAKLKSLRATRDENAVKEALASLKRGAADTENLLALAVDAARVRCTVGEISDAMEQVLVLYMQAN